MKYYVQFTTTNNIICRRENNYKMEYVEPYEVDSIGSDGVFILDGRNNLDNMINDAIERANRLKAVTKIKGFKIVKGSRFDDNNRVLYKGSI